MPAYCLIKVRAVADEYKSCIKVSYWQSSTQEVDKLVVNCAKLASVLINGKVLAKKCPSTVKVVPKLLEKSEKLVLKYLISGTVLGK